MILLRMLSTAMTRAARYRDVRADLRRLTPELVEDAGLDRYDLDEIARQAARIG